MLLTQCADSEEIRDDMPLSKLYELGLKTFKNQEYERSEKYFEALEKQYPYSDYNLQARLMIGFNMYMQRHYTDGAERFREFTMLHPHHKDIPYALYMIGLCLYSRVSYIERDQSAAKDAAQAFIELVERFPKSVYAEDAKLKLQQMIDHISAEELHVARYYEKKHLYHAALARLDYVTKYSIHHAESYYRKMECYQGLGQLEEAEKMKQKLLQEYPDSLFAKKV